MSDWLEAERRVERAQQLSESRRWAEALAELEVALSIDPSHALWHAQRGFLLEELGRPEEAVSSYEQALELDAGDRDVALALGVLLLDLERFPKAIEILEKLAKAFPDFEPAYCHRIRGYAELGRHDRAEEMFYLAQDLHAECPHCFYYMGVSLAARGKWPWAVYCWEKALSFEPNYLGANRRIAEAHRQQGDFDQARDYFLRELREDPGNTDLLFDLADLTLQSGQVESAMVRLEQILELDPDHAAARYALGRLLLSQRQYEKAAACFEIASKLPAEDSDADLSGLDARWGEALLLLGRIDGAEAKLKSAVEKDPSDFRARILLGDCMLASGRFGDAADHYRALQAGSADDPVVHHRIARAQLRGGRFENALEHALKAASLKPDFAEAIFDAALCAIQLGQWRKSKFLLRQGMSVSPENSTFRDLERRLWRFRLRGWKCRITKLFFGKSGSDPTQG